MKPVKIFHVPYKGVAYHSEAEAFHCAECARVGFTEGWFVTKEWLEKFFDAAAYCGYCFMAYPENLEAEKSKFLKEELGE
jgi:hypothetical protein